MKKIDKKRQFLTFFLKKYHFFDFFKKYFSVFKTEKHFFSFILRLQSARHDYLQDSRNSHTSIPLGQKQDI